MAISVQLHAAFVDLFLGSCRMDLTIPYLSVTRLKTLLLRQIQVAEDSIMFPRYTNGKLSRVLSLQHYTTAICLTSVFRVQGNNNSGMVQKTHDLGNKSSNM